MKLSSKISLVGGMLFLTGLTLILMIFYPIIKLEAGYYLQTRSNFNSQNLLQSQTDIQSNSNSGFSIYIPKINALADVIVDVDISDPKVYNLALTKGVAHAKGTSLPGEVGNMFIFSHSSADFYEARKYNSIFYLLNKLEKEDLIEIIYQGQTFQYKVSGKKIIKPDEYSTISAATNQEKETLTLMTCWPPGTSFRRLIVIANRI